MLEVEKALKVPPRMAVSGITSRLSPPLNEVTDTTWCKKNTLKNLITFIDKG